MGAPTPNQGDKVSISKKTLYTLIGIILIVIVAVALYSYWKQSTTNAVVITDFQKHTAGTMPALGTLENWPFTVTVENRGSNDVSELTVYVKMLSNGQELGQDRNQLSTLLVGHQITIDMTIWLDPNVILGKTITYSATLELNGRVISELNLS